jgi:hypothetical protein
MIYMNDDELDQLEERVRRNKNQDALDLLAELRQFRPKVAKPKELTPFERWTTVSYSGVELLKKHSLDEVGIWQVFGEDPNCDLGGSHWQPDLGIHEGRLEDVIREAVEMGSFWTWGGGGTIKQIKINKVKSKEKRHGR